MPKPSAKKAEPQGAASQPTRGMAAAGNIVACVGVGGLLGYGADWLLGTLPWGLIVGLLLGFAAWLRELWGFLNTR